LRGEGEVDLVEPLAGLSACTSVNAPRLRPRTSSGTTTAERSPIDRMSPRCSSSTAASTRSASGISGKNAGRPVRLTSIAPPGAFGSGG
jgi:hypothetical protein